MRKAIVSLLGCFLLAAPSWAAGNPKRGEVLFTNTCEMCHPAGGNALNPAKSLKGPAFVAAFPKDSQIYATIRNGIPKTVMSPFNKERLSDEQVADIIAYIRTLTPTPAPQKRAEPAKHAKKSPPAHSRK